MGKMLVSLETAAEKAAFVGREEGCYQEKSLFYGIIMVLTGNFHGMLSDLIAVYGI
jgi:hypothetical protein